MNAYTDYRVGCCNPGAYKVVLSSDEKVFYGYENVTKYAEAEYHSDSWEHDGRPHSFQVSPKLSPETLNPTTCRTPLRQLL